MPDLMAIDWRALPFEGLESLRKEFERIETEDECKNLQNNAAEMYVLATGAIQCGHLDMAITDQEEHRYYNRKAWQLLAQLIGSDPSDLPNSIATRAASNRIRGLK